MEPKIFGIQHIIYLIVSIAMTIVGLILVAKIKSEKGKFLAVKIGGGVLLFTITLNRTFCEIFWPGSFLPTSLSGILSFALAFSLIFCKKNSAVFQYLAFTALVTGTIATVYPNYISQGLSFKASETAPAIVHTYYTIFCPPTITSLLHHSMQIFLSIMIIMFGWVQFDIKRWYAWPLGYAVNVVYGLFMIKIMGNSDSIYINSAVLPGTFLNWFYGGLLFFLLHIVTLIVIDVIKNKKNCYILQIPKLIIDRFKVK